MHRPGVSELANRFLFGGYVSLWDMGRRRGKGDDASSHRLLEGYNNLERMTKPNFGR
jgi:hypothetical protein